MKKLPISIAIILFASNLRAQIVTNNGQIVSNNHIIATNAATSSPAIDAPFLYYYLDETSGNAIDAVSTNDGTNNSVTQGSAGKINTSYAYNGTTSYTSIPIKTWNTTAYSISFWVKADGTASLGKSIYAEMDILGPATGHVAYFSLGTHSTASTKLDVYLRRDDNTTRINHIQLISDALDNTWHFVVWTDANGGTALLYIDGVLDAADFTYTAPTPLTLNTATLGAARRSTVINFLTGSIDEFATWDRVLTATEVTYLYNSGNGRQYPL